MVLAILLVGALLSISFADAAIASAMLRGKLRMPEIAARSVVSPGGTVVPSLSTIYYFDQLIDHKNPNIGTFKQRYWMDLEFYENGGPIILLAHGEGDAEGSENLLTNFTMTGMIAQQQHGAAILLEHRFFGLSNPRDNLTSQSLELLTIEQAIDDVAYFAQNVDLHLPGGSNVKPDTTSWVVMGGSYGGALASWAMVAYPNVFRAGYVSSAVVEAITDYYAYFTPIREHMPQNCSSDVQAVVTYLDQIHAENNTAAIQNLKDSFGLGNLSHIDDFAAALQLNLFDWQSLQPTSGPGALFFEFCDALEVKNGVNAPATGWGLEHTINAWGSFWNNTYYANHACGGEDAETCLGTYDASQSYWTNVTINNSQRSLNWLYCNQLGWYEAGPPLDQPAIASRILQPIYLERQCVNMFPDKFSSPPSPSVSDVNNMYKGWNLNVDRLFFANGLRDPWREATVSADGLNKANTTMQPIYVGNGFHVSDMFAQNGVIDETIRIVQMAGLDYMKEWLA